MVCRFFSFFPQEMKASVTSLNKVCKLTDQCSCLLSFSTRFIYQYGVSGCKIADANWKPKWLIVLGSRISSSLQNLKVMTTSRTLLLLLLTLAFVFVFRSFSEKSDYLTWKCIQIKSTQDFYVLVVTALSHYCCWFSLLRNGIAVYELWFFSVIFQKNCQEKIRQFCQESYIEIIIYVLRMSIRYFHLIHHLVDENK